MSAKRAQQMRVYRGLRAVYLADHPYCEFPLGCGAQATEIQHRRGRSGNRLIDVTWWSASCHVHNQWAEEHTGEALACGWLVPIEGVA
jgi:hypothetical protein